MLDLEIFQKLIDNIYRTHFKMTALQYYKALGVDLEKIPKLQRDIIGSWYLDDFKWSKKELVKKYGDSILIQKQ